MRVAVGFVGSSGRLSCFYWSGLARWLQTVEYDEDREPCDPLSL